MKCSHIDSIDREMRHLRNCGCRACYTRYKELEQAYYRRQHHYSYIGVDMASEKDMTIMLANPPATVTKTEEPKNIAVKLLVDKLKVEQEDLKKHNTNIEYHTKQLKQHRINKSTTDKNLKELGAALKKLGHKEV